MNKLELQRPEYTVEDSKGDGARLGKTSPDCFLVC